MSSDVGFIEEIASALWNRAGATALTSIDNVPNTFATTVAVFGVLEDLIDQGVAGWAVFDDRIVAHDRLIEVMENCAGKGEEGCVVSGLGHPTD